MDKIYKMTKQGLVYMGEGLSFTKKELKLREDLEAYTTLKDPKNATNSATEVAGQNTDVVTRELQNNGKTTIEGNGSEETKVSVSDASQGSILKTLKTLNPNVIGKLTLEKEPQNSSKQYSSKLVEMRKNSIPFTKKELREYLKNL